MRARLTLCRFSFALVATLSQFEQCGQFDIRPIGLVGGGEGEGRAGKGREVGQAYDLKFLRKRASATAVCGAAVPSLYFSVFCVCVCVCVCVYLLNCT